MNENTAATVANTTVLVDHSFLAAAVYVNGRLEWAHDADEAAEHLIWLLDLDVDENDYDYETDDVLEAVTAEFGITLIFQENVTGPIGNWNGVPALLEDNLAQG